MTTHNATTRTADKLRDRFNTTPPTTTPPTTIDDDHTPPPPTTTTTAHPTPPTDQARTATTKTRLPLYATPDNARRIRAAIPHLLAQEGFTSMSEWAEHTLLQAVSRAEDTYNNGQPWNGGKPGQSVPKGRPPTR